MVNACTHITKYYYPADQYNRFTAAEKKKVFQNKGKHPGAANESKSDTLPTKELNVHIRQMSTVIKNYNKHIIHIKANNDEEDLMESSDNKSVLNTSNRENPDLGCHGQGSANMKNGSG